MGDIASHAEVAEEIMGRVEAARDGENVRFFELGNFLTDVSQMRDPTAMVGAKKTIWELRTNFVTAALANPVADLADYLDEIMGLPGPQGGLLTAWVRDLFFIDGVEKFRRYNLDPSRFEYIWLRHFTQYYPHEHMDFPPWPLHDVIGERRPSQWSLHRCEQEPTRGEGRNLYQYQEEQIEYISDLLTKVERDWARAPLDPGTLAQREELLTRFGHASHALEDFFFHSNFVERAWKETGRPMPMPESDETTEGGDHHELDAANPTRLRRIYFRRLRSPMGSGDQLDTEDSSPMSAVYTGYFAGKDVFHTLVDGIQGMASNPRIPPEMQDMLRQTSRAHGAGTPEERERENQAFLEQHKRNLQAGVYVASAQAAQARGDLHAKSVEAIQRMCRIDKEMFDRYTSIDLGIVGLLKALLDMAEDTHRESSRAADDLDRRGIIESEPTDNGASAENIGSHTLLAKDSERKYPLREQAASLAACAALYVAQRMIEDRGRTRLPVARSVPEAPADRDGGSSNTADFRFVDWLHLLQHFVQHPTEAESVGGVEWWKRQLEETDPTQTGHILRFLRDRAEVDRRCAETKKQELERKYDELAVALEREWRTVQARATGTLVGAVIGAVAGAIAGAMIGAALGGVGGAILGGLIGAVGGAVIGGALGALIGGLF